MIRVVKAFKKQFYLSKLMIPDTTCTKKIEYEKNLSQFLGIINIVFFFF